MKANHESCFADDHLVVIMIGKKRLKRLDGSSSKKNKPNLRSKLNTFWNGFHPRPQMHPKKTWDDFWEKKHWHDTNLSVMARSISLFVNVFWLGEAFFGSKIGRAVRRRVVRPTPPPLRMEGGSNVHPSPLCIFRPSHPQHGANGRGLWSCGIRTWKFVWSRRLGLTTWVSRKSLKLKYGHYYSRVVKSKVFGRSRSDGWYPTVVVQHQMRTRARRRNWKLERKKNRD